MVLMQHNYNIHDIVYYIYNYYSIMYLYVKCVQAYCGRHISIATTPLRLLTAGGGEAPPTLRPSSPPHSSTTVTTVT